MGYYSQDVYYNPEAFDLELIAEVDTGLSFEYDMFIVLRHKITGQIYICEDSGCSCPSPFESKTLEECTPVKSLEELLAKYDECFSAPYATATAEDKAGLVEKTMNLTFPEIIVQGDSNDS